MDEQLDQLLRNRQWREAADVYSILLRMQNNQSKDRSIFYLLGRSECFLQLGDYEAVMEDCRSINDFLADFPYSESVRNRARSQLLRAILALEASTRDNEISRRQHEIGQDCESGTHQLDIVSDVGRNWIWRSPPRVFDADAYKLCKYWDAKQSCHFGLQCVEAHGMEELREWKERYYCRQKRLQQAYEHEVIGKSYTEQLLEKLKFSSHHLLSDIVDYVEDQCSSSLIATVVYKSSQKEWIFKLLTNTRLRAVAFLNDVNRSCFSIRKVLLISEGVKTELVVRNNQEFINDNSSGLIVTGYEVTILFKTEVFGTFKQTVSFDFCREPILAKDLCVEVIPEELVQKTNDLRNEIVFTISERWTDLNAEIIPFVTTVSSNHNQLFQLDAATDLSKFISGHDKELTVDNYKTYMHNLLYIEEIARNMQLSEYNIKSKLSIVKNYMLSSANLMSTITKYSNGGELFALIQITQSLSEDTLGGRLILKNSNSVFLLVDQLHQEKRKPKVYEALIEDKCKNVIYLKLSSTMVNDLDLLPDTFVYAQLQFQLDRLSFCEWHQAVDKIPDIKLIFPDIYLERFIPWSPQRQWGDHVDSRLNPKQKEAIIAITTSSRVPLPPVLVIGPFGTGKTFTLAQALKILIKQDGTRILICTYSNSAADIYIKDYLHAYSNEGHHEARPLRIYYQKRWVTTVHPIVRQYCLIEEQGGGAYSFRMPTIDEVKKYRIIVMTLSSSSYLSNLGLPQGYFTHILLDEAAQALECNAIIPLSLANRHTRIVLAGDHMQLSPEVISPFAKELGLHVSLLERLYYLYPSSFPCKILLSENYRAHEAIIDFTSDSFYEQKLIASGKQPKHPNRHPLTFFTAKGEDIQTINSTGFFNNSEVYEIVERVCGLKNTWPTCWGDFDERSIGVMTPYGDQVFRIRAELRKRHMGMVSVESVLNVQGKQFRAIFLSTVRTRKNCSDNDGNTHDYGFLSNLKLLNTAITRAQSLVSVVGDPVALCTVGRCSKVWEKFIHTCAQNNSLFGVTWQSLKNELDGLELKKLYGLNPLAPEFIPKNIPPTNCKMYAAVPLTYQPPMFNCNMKLSDAHPGIPVFVPNTCGPYVQNCGMQLNHPIVRPSRYFEPSLAPRNVPPPIQMQHQQNRPQFVPNETHVAPNVSSTSNVMEELIGLLPNNLSLGAFLADPLLMQKQWIEYLGVTKGPEAVKKLEFFVKMAKGEETVNHPINPGMYPGNVVYTPFSQPNPVVRSDISLLN